MKYLLLFGLAILAGCAMKRVQRRTKPAWAEHFKGWHKVLGALAVVCAFLILLNPELAALGLLGDSAFFDVLVLALGLQMQTVFAQAWQRCRHVLTQAVLWLRTPSLGTIYLLGMASLAFASALAALQRIIHRIGPGQG